jgi:hypothetical protein
MGQEYMFLTALNIHVVVHWITTITLLQRYQHVEDHTTSIFMVEMSTLKMEAVFTVPCPRQPQYESSPS